MEPSQGLVAGKSIYMRAFLFVILACLPWCCPARAQHYTFSSFGQVDGLLNQDVSAIVQDGRGILWIGTENGLFQADGSSFSRVESFQDAVHGQILAMHVDSKGRVWVFGSKHLVFFTSDRQLHLVPGVNPSRPIEDGVVLTSLPSQPDTVFLLRNGRLQQIRSNDGGASWKVSAVFSEELLHQQPRLGKLSSLVADSKRQALWTGCGDAVCELQPTAVAVQISPAVTAWTTNRGIPSNAWSNLLVAHDGHIWARGTGDVLMLDPESGAVRRFNSPTSDGDSSLRYSQLAEDRDGSVLTIVPGGLARLKHGAWTSLTSQNGLPSSRIICMFFDREGDFWLAPTGQGLWRWLGYEDWEHWTRSEGLSDNLVFDMLRDKRGQFWVTATNDLDRIDEVHAKAIPNNLHAPLREIQTIAQDTRGHLWVGSSDGSLVDFDPVTHQARHVADGLGNVYKVKEDIARPGQMALGRMWICTTKGIGYVSSEDSWSKLHMVHDPGAPSANIWEVTQDRSGALWFSALGGIYRLANGTWTHIQFPEGTKLPDYPMLQAAPDGSFWLQAALPKPLLHIAVTGSQASIIDWVPQSIIGSDDISFIKIDSRKWVWVGTDLGVYVFDGVRWVHCTQEDGLISDDTDTDGVFEDTDGSMWFGTAGGLSHLLHPEKLFHVPTPEVNVRDVRLNGKELQAGEEPSFDVRGPELSVELFSTYYERPHAMVFRYRLLGLENEWQTAENGRLHFSDLPPGDFTLSVQAMDKRVNVLSSPVDYSFTILPPWYRRDRFKALACMLLVLLIASGWQLSLRSLKASETNLKIKVDRQTAQLLAEKRELERAQLELVETARRDALTGLLNRGAIFDALAQMRLSALEQGSTLSVIMADMDHFKSINDRFGHAVGDAVLRECAERFKEAMRPGDVVGRYGGEELLIVIPGLDQAHALARMEDIRAAIASQPVVHGEHVLYVTCSFGVAWVSKHHANLEAVVDAADEALYMAKQNGRNRVEFNSYAAEEYVKIRRF